VLDEFERSEAQFQGSCRDLHSEATAAMVAAYQVRHKPLSRSISPFARTLDKGNPRRRALAASVRETPPGVSPPSFIQIAASRMVGLRVEEEGCRAARTKRWIRRGVEWRCRGHVFRPHRTV
jgi:hypothetical protein